MTPRIIAFADSWVPFVVLIIVVILNNKKLYKELGFLFLYLLAQFVFNTWANYLPYYYSDHRYSNTTNNYYIYHIGLPVAFLALVYFFKVKQKDLFFSKAFFLAGLFLFFYFIFSSFFVQTIATFNYISYTIASAYILAVCINYLQRIVHVDIEFDILKSPVFWFVAGLFIYYSTSLVVFFSFSIFIKKLNEMGGTVWSVQNIMMMVGFALITKGILCAHSQTKR